MNTFMRLCICLLLATALATVAAADDAPAGLTREQLNDWLETYGRAWQTRDAALVVTLFSADATYQDDPYTPPHQGHAGIQAYWSGVTKDQRNIKFDYELISVSGSTGIAHWTAELDVEPSKAHIGLNGVFVLEFDAGGKCRILREWWHLKPAQAAAGGQ